MKLLRDVSGARLVHLLEKLGYEVIRQKGSHIQLKKLLKKALQPLLSGAAPFRRSAITATYRAATTGSGPSVELSTAS